MFMLILDRIMDNAGLFGVLEISVLWVIRFNSIDLLDFIVIICFTEKGHRFDQGLCKIKANLLLFLE